jgi:hypothetical protein
VCGREALLDLLSSHLEGQNYCPVVQVQEQESSDNKKANFKTLGNNGATSENRDGQTAYLTAENLGVKVTVLADTGSVYSAIPRSAVEDARKRGFPLKFEVLPGPIMLNMDGY